ncbi:MipA/OmpV family protein [Jiella sp. M17.18]|uniref:MipA/OmpV family protein n=1 Tax=Jiella sp. M17.18 TaxID=3234247 RepID=UPI0034E01DBB
MTLRSAGAAFALLLGSTLLAHAADVVTPYETAPQPAAPAKVDYNGADFVFELGVEGIVQPEYLGSKDYQIAPSALFSVEYVNLPGIGSFGGPDGLGFSIGPSFKYQPKRDSSDYSSLRGLDDVDASYELGIKASYEWEYAEVSGNVRYALGGADGFVGEFGASAIARPTEALTLKFGPTVSLASSDYMDTYFGVTPRESANTGGRLDAYSPSGGFKSVGLAASARYEVFKDYFITADATYDRLVGDAADSPIVKAGDKNQYYFGLGISKRFSLDLF